MWLSPAEMVPSHLYLPKTYVTPSLAHWQERSKYKGVSGRYGCERGWLGKKLAKFFRDPILNFQRPVIFHAGNRLRHLKCPPPHTHIPKKAAGVADDTKRGHSDALHSPAVVQGKVPSDVQSCSAPSHLSSASFPRPLSCLLENFALSIATSVEAKLLQSLGVVLRDVFAHRNWETCQITC